MSILNIIKGRKTTFGIISLAFLVVSVIAIVYSTNSQAQLFASQAKEKVTRSVRLAQERAKNFQGYVDSQIRQRERAGGSGAGPACTGAWCLGPEIIANQNDPANQTGTAKEIIDTYNAAVNNQDQAALDKLKANSEALYNGALSEINNKQQATAPETAQKLTDQCNADNGITGDYICSGSGLQEYAYVRKLEAAQYLARIELAPPGTYTNDQIKQYLSNVQRFINEGIVLQNGKALTQDDYNRAKVKADEVIAQQTQTALAAAQSAAQATNVVPEPTPINRGAIVQVTGEGQAQPAAPQPAVPSPTEPEKITVSSQFKTTPTTLRTIGDGCNSDSECGSGYCSAGGSLYGRGAGQQCRVNPGTVAIQSGQTIPKYAICQGATGPNADAVNAACDYRTTQTKTALDAITLGSFSKYVDAYSPNKVTFGWQQMGFKSLDDCTQNAVGRQKSACNTYEVTKEQLASSTELGTTITTEGALIASGVGGALQLGGGTAFKAVAGRVLTQTLAVQAQNATGMAAASCTADGISSTGCQLNLMAMALSWTNVGVLERVTGLAAQGTQEAINGAKVLNLGFTATNTLYTGTQTYNACRNQLLSLGCVVGGTFTVAMAGLTGYQVADLVRNPINIPQGIATAQKAAGEIVVPEGKPAAPEAPAAKPPTALERASSSVQNWFAENIKPKLPSWLGGTTPLGEIKVNPIANNEFQIEGHTGANFRNPGAKLGPNTTGEIVIEGQGSSIKIGQTELGSNQSMLLRPNDQLTVDGARLKYVGIQDGTPVFESVPVPVTAQPPLGTRVSEAWASAETAPWYRRLYYTAAKVINPDYAIPNANILKINNYGTDIFALNDEPGALIQTKNGATFIRNNNLRPGNQIEISVQGRSATTGELGIELAPGDPLKLGDQVVIYNGIDSNGFPQFSRVSATPSQGILTSPSTINGQEVYPIRGSRGTTLVRNTETNTVWISSNDPNLLVNGHAGFASEGMTSMGINEGDILQIGGSKYTYNGLNSGNIPQISPIVPPPAPGLASRVATFIKSNPVVSFVTGGVAVGIATQYNNIRTALVNIFAGSTPATIPVQLQNQNGTAISGGPPVQSQPIVPQGTNLDQLNKNAAYDVTSPTKKALYGGDQMEQLYELLKSQTDSYWTKQTGHTLTKAEFLALMMIAEASNRDVKVLQAQMDAARNMLWNSKDPYTLAQIGKDRYCYTADCQGGGGIFNFIANLEVARRRYNSYVLNPGENSITKLANDSTFADFYAENGYTIEDIANYILKDPNPTTWDPNVPSGWGNSEGWMYKAAKSGNIGTTDYNGIYYTSGGPGADFIYTDAQMLYWKKGVVPQPNAPKPVPAPLTPSNPAISQPQNNAEPATSGFSIFMQTDPTNNELYSIRNGADTLLHGGCAPSTEYNILNILGKKPDMNNILKTLIFACDQKYGCQSSADAVLLNLQQNGVNDAYNYGVQNQITDTNGLKKYTGILVYGGTVNGATSHVSAFNCTNGSCNSIDSYFGSGKPESCNIQDANTIKCGSTSYHVGPTDGVPDSLFPVKSQ